MDKYEIKLSSYLILAIGGFCTNLVGMGLGRFSYTPILVIYKTQGWLSLSQADYLGFINFMAYLLGSYASLNWLKRYSTPYYWIKLSVILSCISFLACAYNGGFFWFVIWRFVAGITCAILTIIIPSSVSQLIPDKFIGLTSGIIFSGMSGGIILAGVIVPILSNYGLAFIWIGFGIVAAIAMVIAFLTLQPLRLLKFSESKVNEEKLKQPYALKLLAIAYAFCGAAFVPYALFLGVYLSHIGYSSIDTGVVWVVFGLGGLMGTALTGLIGDLIGIEKTLFYSLFLGAAALLVTVMFPFYLVICCCSFIIGMLLPSTVTLTCASSKTIACDHQAAWAKMTIYFAIGQAINAYFISFLLDRLISFNLIFNLAATLFIFASIIVLKVHRLKKES